VSQLGLMVMAMGVGAYGVGIFHLITHAFFKALLFLAAGSVIHALHGEQNISKMGGLKTYLVSTAIVFGMGYLAIVGFPGFSGWFSKDKILYESLATGHGTLFWVGLICTLFTAIYMTRLFCLVFFRIPRIDVKHLQNIHESPKSMLFPMYILAVLSVLGGTKLFSYSEVTQRIFPPVVRVVVEGGTVFSETEVAWYVTLAVLAVIFLTYKVFASWPWSSLERWKKTFESGRRLSSLVSRQYRVDDLLSGVGGNATRLVAKITGLFDDQVVDTLFSRFSKGVQGTSAAVARIQSGFVQLYALTMWLGCVVIAWLLLRGSL